MDGLAYGAVPFISQSHRGENRGAKTDVVQRINDERKRVDEGFT